jgi:hypothetical protein
MYSCQDSVEKVIFQSPKLIYKNYLVNVDIKLCKPLSQREESGLHCCRKRMGEVRLGNKLQFDNLCNLLLAQ